MAYVGLDTRILKSEGCTKPEKEPCPLPNICYDYDFYQCKYWKQEFWTLREQIESEEE